MTFVRLLSKKLKPINTLKNITFSKKKFKTLNLTLLKNMGESFTSLKTSYETNYSSGNYEPSNLLFRFINFCIGPPS